MNRFSVLESQNRLSTSQDNYLFAAEIVSFKYHCRECRAIHTQHYTRRLKHPRVGVLM